MKNAQNIETTKYVSILGGQWNPYLVIDESKLILTGQKILSLKESELMPGMEVFRSYVNPFTQETIYEVCQDNFEYKVVYESDDFELAREFAKKYASENRLIYA